MTLELRIDETGKVHARMQDAVQVCATAWAVLAPVIKTLLRHGPVDVETLRGLAIASEERLRDLGIVEVRIERVVDSCSVRLGESPASPAVDGA